MGNNRELKKSIKLMIIGIAVCLSVVAILFSVTNSNIANPSFSTATNETFNQNWYRDNQVIAVPNIYDLSNASIQNTLPDLKDNQHLIFKSNYNAIEVKINNETIYKDEPQASRSSGDYYYFIPLEKEYSNQLITIDYTFNAYQKSIYIHDFYIDTPNSFFMNELKEDFGFIVFNAFLIVLGIILLFFYGWLRLRHTEVAYNYFLYLGGYVLLSAIWLLTDSELPQIYFSNANTLFLISIYAFMFQPYPLLSLVNAMTNSQKGYLKSAKLLVLVNVIVQTILYLCFKLEFTMTLPITHLVYILSCLAIFNATYSLYKQKALSFSDKCYIVSVMVLMVSSIISLINFIAFPYLNRNFSFEIGLFAFVTILLISILHKFSLIVDNHQQTSFYKVMAYTDLSTHTLNRSAFDEQMTKLNDDKDFIVLAMFDLNDLKNINDTFGHTTGDLLLKAASECIRKTFEGIGETYRYGGDEFVTIIVNQSVDMNSLLSLLNDEIAEYNQTSMHPLSIAGGYAIHKADTPLNMSNLLREADQNMYKSKHHYRRNKPVY